MLLRDSPSVIMRPWRRWAYRVCELLRDRYPTAHLSNRRSCECLGQTQNAVHPDRGASYPRRDSKHRITQYIGKSTVSNTRLAIHLVNGSATLLMWMRRGMSAYYYTCIFLAFICQICCGISIAPRSSAKCPVVYVFSDELAQGPQFFSKPTSHILCPMGSHPHYTSLSVVN